jgi:hypothetical protein
MGGKYQNEAKPQSFNVLPASRRHGKAFRSRPGGTGSTLSKTRVILTRNA